MIGFLSMDPIDSINGAPAGGGTNITLQGPASCPSSASGAIMFGDSLNPVDATGSISNLYMTGFCGFALWAPRVNGLKVSNVVFSSITYDPFGTGTALILGQHLGSFDSNSKCVFGAQIGGTGANQQNYFFGIAGNAISVWDTCNGDLNNRNNKIFNNYIGICEELDTGLGFEGCADGTPNQGIGGNGVYIRETNGTQVGGPGAGEGNFIARSGVAGVQITGNNASGNSVRGNKIGVSRQGDFSRPNGTGVLISAGADNNTVGGTNAGESNTISSNTSRGVTIDGAGTSGNHVSGNVIGLNTARTQLRPNGDGIGVTGAADTAQIDNNVIAANTLWGIYIAGGGGNAVQSNTIGLRGTGNNANDNTAAANGNGGMWINDGGGNTLGPGNRIAGNNGTGVQISGENADGNVVKGNTIGLNNAGASSGNAGGGVVVFAGADNTLIGGAVVADGNVVSGNAGAGVRVNGNTTDATTIRHNYVGTDATGNAARANSGEGIRIDQGATNTTIANNEVAGNLNDGIKLETGTSGSYVILNQVGVPISGTTPLPNSASGISILSGANNNIIGDPVTPFLFNVIAGNTGSGIFVADAGTANNTIAGNIIGSAGFANSTGVYITASAVNTQVLGNIISQNTQSGVAIFGTGTVGNAINDDLIYDNGGLGIDLDGNGVSANDSGDGDIGPNNLQNFPVLGNVVIGNNSVTMIATLNSLASQAFSVTFYRSDRCDPSGFGEGQVKLGTATINTGASGNGNVPVMYPVANSLTKPSWGSAIARSASGNTSEFSKCVAISDEIFRNGLETSGPVAPSEDETAASADPVSDLSIDAHVETSDADGSSVTLSVANNTATRLPAQVVGISSSAAVAVKDVHASSGRCALAGRIECQVPSLAPGETIAIDLQLTPLEHAAMTLSVVSEVGGKPTQPQTYSLATPPRQ
jgi:parallel beta-helix repeat protein